MIIRSSWGRIIRARWSRSLLLAAALSPGLPGQTLETLAKAFREKPGPLTRSPLERFLLKHPKDAEGALARLVLFHGDTSAGAIERLRAARGPLGQISDYVDWMAASTAQAAKNCTAALTDSVRVLEVPRTPLEGRAALLAVQCGVEAGDLTLSQTLLERHQQAMTAAQAAYWKGILAERRGDLDAARAALASVLVNWPRTAEAAEARNMLPLENLRPAERLARATRLLDQGDAAGARGEFTQLLPLLSGAETEQARVKIGICDYRLRKPTAHAALSQARVENAEADAERLFYALLAARRAGAYDSMAVAMRELSERHPRSHYRLEALANAASQYWVLGDHARSLPLYETCAVEFAQRPEGRDCAWKVAVQSFILGRGEAERKLEAYLEAEPAGEHASGALYFLGRAAELRRDRAAAKAFFQKVIELFPNHFYAELSRERLLEAGLQAQVAAPAVVARLKAIAFPPGAPFLSFEPNEATRRRMARAELLARGALYDFAELELRHEARQAGQPHLLAMAAARMATRRGAPEQGIRYVKSIFPGYVNLPVTPATMPLLKLAYPMPFKDPLWTYAAQYEIDPYVLAGLIRQESEFSPRVVSRANAHGLAQIMPATGRDLARRLGIKGYSQRMLFDPNVNVRMGAYYLRNLVSSLGGRLDQALASYNAGKSRVTQWLERGQYRDTAEFVESIPFHETRGYVQSVMRNAGIYRRLYGESTIRATPGLTSGNGESSIGVQPNDK